MRVLLLGYGNIGRHHLRIMQSRSDLNVVAVVDQAMPELKGLEVYADLDSYFASVPLEDRAEAAVVATPISTHVALAGRLLRAGLHVFVEKPVAPTYAEACALCDLAKSQGLVLGVGHSERFNPAFSVFLREFRAGITGKVYRLECDRTGPFPQRVGDAGASIDLAVHDLDSLNWVLTNQEPSWIFAKTEQRIHPSHDDGLNAMLGYDPDILVRLTVNWLSPRKNRILDVYGHRGMLRCDFYRQEVTFFENLYNRSRPDEYGIGGIEVGPETRYEVESWEPLAKEHEDFWQRVSQGVSDADALLSACLAVRMSNLCVESSRQGRVLRREDHE